MLGNREDLALHGMVSDLGLNCLSLSYKRTLALYGFGKSHIRYRFC